MKRTGRAARSARVGTRVPWVAPLAIVAAALTACGTEQSGRMTPLPPDSGWAERLAQERAEKDRSFRENPDTPLLAEDVAAFRGLAYWEPDPAYYFVGPVNLYYAPKRFTIITTTGKERPCERVGWVRFEIDERLFTLQVYRLLDQELPEGDPGYFLPFKDATNGEETYPAGRYVDLVGPPGGPYVLDFNAAYNPYCAYGAPERYVCPVTPAENRLEARIEAGERGYRLPEGD
jgi:uncharacterized protein (DUF1684 family)